MKTKYTFLLLFIFAIILKINAQQVSTFTDSRDGKTYKITKIGDYWWMAENLNFAVPKSLCYNNDSTNSNKYGRLYEWETAKTVCPSGWFLPSDSDWHYVEKHIAKFENNDETNWEELGYAYKLKENDLYNFNLQWSGYIYSSDFSRELNESAYFWTSSECRRSAACCMVYCRKFYKNNKTVYREHHSHIGGTAYSVRCIRLKSYD